MKKNREKENSNLIPENVSKEDGRVFSDAVIAASLVIVLIGMIIWSPMIALIIEARFNDVQPTRYEHIILSTMIFIAEMVIFLIIVMLPIHLKKKIRDRKAERSKE